jgi:uncharacterized protein (TIGR02594 family)
MNDFVLGAIVGTACSTNATVLLLFAFWVFFRYGSSSGSRAKDAVIAGQLVPAPQSPAQAPPAATLPNQLPPPLIAPAPSKSPPAAIPAAPSIQTTTLTGKVSWFGGPNDTGVAPSEGLALVEVSEAHLFPGVFLAAQPPGTTGLARRLDPSVNYIACRWDYKQTPRSFLQGKMVEVAANSKVEMARPVDWGPNINTGRIADLSPGLLAKLGLKTDDTATITIPLPTTVSQLTGQPPQASVPTTAGAEPPWLTIARGEIGFHELPNNTGIGKYIGWAGFGAEGDSWCSIFAAGVLRQAGIDITGVNAMAESFASAPSMTKIDAPRLGAIAVFWRGTKASGTGHVGFYVGQADAGHINVLGGNENDQVMIEAIPTAGSTMGLLGYYWPTSAPAAASTEPKLS